MKEFMKKKFSGSKKKIMIVTALVAAVAVVGYANYLVTNGASSKDSTKKVSTEPAEEEAVSDVFSEYREERSESRTKEISYIDSVVTSAETDEATKSEAQKQKLALVSNMEHELTIEGLIKTKLSTETVVTVKEDAVNVVVDKTTLTDEEVAQIAEIVKTQTGKPSSNIKIMPQSK